MIAQQMHAGTYVYRVLFSVLFLGVQRDFVGNGDDNVPELWLSLLSLSLHSFKK